MELMTANKRLNDLETSCKFLAEKYDALMTSIHDLKKHNKLSEFIATTLDIPQERTYTGQCSEPIMGFYRFTPTAFRIWENIPYIKTLPFPSFIKQYTRYLLDSQI